MNGPLSALDTALARIAASEPDLQAWAALDAEAARAEAFRVAEDAPLRGALLGVKDIYEVRGFATRCGLSLDDAVPASSDADVVRKLRDAGAVVLGKTQTTAFAWLDPAPTRNPHDGARTPGGSSAGSAAAIAAGHCTLALGSQTAGSTIRPAAFCGVVGYKPTFGRIATEGMTPLAPSLDHVGIFASRVADLTAAVRVLDPALSATREHTFRVALDVLADDDCAEACTRRALEGAADALRRSGSSVEEIQLPAAVHRSRAAIEVIIAFESVAAHGEHWRCLGDRLPPRLHELFERGRSTSRSEYEDALTERALLTVNIEALFAQFDVLLTPCAPGEAPAYASTGDARYVRPWTYFGVPAIAVPTTRGPHGLPLGVQLVSAHDRDATLLGAAQQLESALQSAERRSRMRGR